MAEVNVGPATALHRQADEKEAEAKALRQQAHKVYMEEGRKLPLAERLVYAATARCKCGAGMAYDPFAQGNPDSVFVHEQDGPSYWDCSAILLGTAIPKGQPGSVQHEDQLPFAFYNIKSEKQPSAGGATTRPKQ